MSNLDINTQSSIKEFERIVVKSCIFDPDFSSRAIEKIEPLYFDDEYYQIIFKKLKEFYTQNQQNKNNIPSIDIIKTELKRDNVVIKNFKDNFDILFKHVNQLYELETIDISKEYLIEKTTAWIKKNGTVNSVYSIAEVLQQEDDPLKKSNRIEKLIPELESCVNTTLQHKEVIRLSDFSNIENVINNLANGVDIVQSNIQIINKAIGDNLKRGCVNLLIGGTGQGKSIHLLGHFLSPLERGYNCLYASFELNTNDITERYISNIFNLPMDKLRPKAMNDQIGFIQEVRNKHNNINFINRGEGYLVNYPAKTAGVTEVNEYVKYIERRDNIKIDCVIFDYVKNMKLGNQFSDGKNQPEWSKLDSIIKEMESFAISNNVLVWSAMQLKPDAKEKEVLTDVDIASSKQVLDSCSAAYAFMKDKKTGHHKCFLLKSRRSNTINKEVFLLGVDFPFQRIRDIDQTLLTLTEDDEQFIKDVRDNTQPKNTFNKKGGINKPFKP